MVPLPHPDPLLRESSLSLLLRVNKVEENVSSIQDTRKPTRTQMAYHSLNFPQCT